MQSPGGWLRGTARSQPLCSCSTHIIGMPASAIYAPTHLGARFVAAIFNTRGLLVASHAFSTREAAEEFVRTCTPERAGYLALPTQTTAERGSYDDGEGTPGS